MQILAASGPRRRKSQSYFDAHIWDTFRLFDFLYELHYSYENHYTPPMPAKAAAA
jgi:hypothetical protein